MTTQTQQPDDNAPVVNTGPLSTGRQRTGRVARLPKKVRDIVNTMLLDGHTYAQIIQAVPIDGPPLSEDSLSMWKSGGYQDWLREQQRLDVIRSRQDFAVDLFTDLDAAKIHQATLQVAATNLCDLLADLDPVALRATLQEDPDKYTRLLNAIARLSDGQIRCERHRAQEAERLANLQKEKEKASSQKRGISPETLSQAETILKLL